MNENTGIVFRNLAIQALRELGGRFGEDVNRAPSAVVRLVDRLIEEGRSIGASDIHIEPRIDSIHVRYRRDGLLEERFEPLPKKIGAALVSRIKVMAGMNIAQTQQPQDGHIRYNHYGGTTNKNALPELETSNRLDLRVSSLPSIHGEILVLRLMNRGAEVLSIDEVCRSKENAKKLRELIHRPSGLVILCGPMNSGKTTTLYAAVSELADARRSIVTLEDPVERMIAGINQVQLNEKAGLTYSAGLRAVLRQDAETILLGEIRDEETAKLAVRIALTGHMLLTTLHTENAVSAVYRLLEMGAEPYLLAATLGGVVAQRLVRKLCPACRKAYTATPEEAAIFPKLRGATIYQATGCPECRETGYTGRVALQEILCADVEFRNCIASSPPRTVLEKTARHCEYNTLAQDGIARVLAGDTDLRELRRVLYGAS